MPPIRIAPTFAMLCAVLFAGVAASAESPAEARLRQEKIRTTLLRAFDEMLDGEGGRDVARGRWERAIADVTALGPEAVEFLVPEIENPGPRYFPATIFLGALGSRDAVPALRTAMEAADATGGPIGRDRKAWTGIALARLGEADAVELMESGDAPAGAVPLWVGQNALQVAAMLSAPESVDVLLGRFRRVTADARKVPENERDALLERRFLLLEAARYATRSTPHAGLLELAREFHDHEDLRIRQHALGALLDHGGPDDLPIARRHANDDFRITRGIALQMLAEFPGQRALDLIAFMQRESTAGNRGMLQAALVDHLGPRAATVLATELEHEDPIFRINALRAAAKLGDAGRPVLHDGLRDPDLRVALNAILLLRAKRDPKLVEILLPRLLEDNWAFAQPAIDAVVDLAPQTAGPRVAGRLIQRDLKAELSEGDRRARVTFLLQALVRCRFHAAVDDVRAALTGVTDPTLLEEAGFHLTTLESIAATGDDPVAWRAALGSENPVMRRVAREWILETGDAEGLRAIEATFPVLDDGDRTHLFATLARHPRPELFARIEEVLAGPEYDDPTREEVRRWAAWAALRAGTDDAARVLAENVKRREGRDYLPFMYWIELRPDEALPWIGRTRTTRLMAFRHDRAYEQQTLDRLERRMRRGLPPDGTDGTPDDLKFQM